MLTLATGWYQPSIIASPDPAPQERCANSLTPPSDPKSLLTSLSLSMSFSFSSRSPDRVCVCRQGRTGGRREAFQASFPPLTFPLLMMNCGLTSVCVCVTLRYPRKVTPSQTEYKSA